MKTFLSIATLLSIGALGLFAQTAQLTGTVDDQSKAVVPNAKVAATNIDTKFSRSAATNDQGSYVLPLLPPGRYSVTVQAEGFKPVERTGISLAVDQVIRIDFSLEVGQITESVEVTTAPPVIDQETSSLGQVIENKRIVELPLNGRNVMSLVQLSAGVTPQAGINAGFADPAGFVTSNLEISGGRGSMNALLLDGANNAAPEREEVAVAPSVDAVQEFKVYTNGASAEFGRTTGGVLSVVTKSGTNELHGSAYEFVRNEKFDARNAFAASRAPFRYNQPGGSIGGPVFLPKLYDGRNRTFFFFSYEAYRYITYTDRVFTIPTMMERAGDFSATRAANGNLIPIFDPGTTAANPAGSGYVRNPFPGNVIPSSRFDRISAGIMHDVPPPNRIATNPFTNVNNYGEQVRRKTNNDQWIGRFDHNLTQSHRLSYRLAYNRNIILPDSQFGNYLTQGEQNDIFTRNYSQQTASWVWTMSPSKFSDFRAGYVRTIITRRPPTSGADLDRLGYPAIIPRVQFPSHQIQDFTELGGGQMVNGGLHTITAHEAVTMIAGSHTIKFGGEVWAIRRNRFQFAGQSGVFQFNRDLTNNPQSPTNSGYGVATFLLGAVNAGSLTIGDKRYERGKYFAGFLQDDWRVNKRLTLNLGLRYDFETNPIDIYNRKSNFNFFKTNPITGLPGVLEYPGVDFGGSPVQNDYNNLGPRVGFALTLDSSAKTVARGSYGIFYQPNFETFESNLGWSSNTPFADPSVGPRPVFYLSQGPSHLILPPGNSLGPAGYLGAAVQGRQPGDRVGYVQQWQFGLQRALPMGWSLETVYVGSKGTRLSVGGSNAEANQMDPRYLALGFDLQTQVPNPFYDRGIFGRTVARSQLLRPYPAYLGVAYLTPRWGSSIYHGLQFTARKVLSSGHSVIVSYTTGKLIDDIAASLSSGFAGYGTDVGGYQNAYDRRAERSISGADVSQRLVVSYIWELPFGKGRRWVTSGPANWVIGGWQLTGILTAAKGVPLAVRGAANNAANRPNSAGRSAKIDNPSATKWFDTSAFSVPPLFNYGNVGRVLPDVRAPGVVQLDMGIQKFFAVRERLRFQVRGEAFNLSNKVNLGPPNTSFVSTAFGTINSTNTPARIIQLGAKMIF